jgi:hypothetical protein
MRQLSILPGPALAALAALEPGRLRAHLPEVLSRLARTSTVLCTGVRRLLQAHRAKIRHVQAFAAERRDVCGQCAVDVPGNVGRQGTVSERAAGLAGPAAATAVRQALSGLHDLHVLPRRLAVSQATRQGHGAVSQPV